MEGGGMDESRRKEMRMTALKVLNLTEKTAVGVGADADSGG